MAIPSQYRRQIFIGGRYLEDRDLNSLQTYILNAEEQGLGAVYREGALFNTSISLSGNTVTLFPTTTGDMLVFLDGRFEPFTAGPLDFSGLISDGAYPAYANYEIAIISAGPSDDTHDPALIDTLSGSPTANAGQLNISISTVDTSSTPVNTDTQLEKNTVPIVLFNVINTGGTLSLQQLDNINTQALAAESVSGLVRTTTGNPLVVADDDPRNNNARNPIDSSVVNSSVADIVPGGTNTDGSPITPVTSGPGISSDKIIHSTLSTTVTWIIDAIRTWIGDYTKLSTGNLSASIISTLWNHVGVSLGSGATHPMPTASDVGAAPLSHVGQALDLSTSHPPLIQTDTDAWEVLDTVNADPTAYAFDVRTGATIKGGITHGGDTYCGPANSIVATPAVGGYYAGPLGKLSNIALLLAQVAATPIVSLVGYATIAYVDAQITSCLAAAGAYTDSKHYPMQERLFLGYFTSGQRVDRTNLGAGAYTSSITGFVYGPSNVQYYEIERVSSRDPSLLYKTRVSSITMSSSCTDQLN